MVEFGITAGGRQEVEDVNSDPLARRGMGDDVPRESFGKREGCSRRRGLPTSASVSGKVLTGAISSTGV